MGDDANCSGLCAPHDDQIVVDVHRKPHWVEWSGCLPRREHERLLSPDHGWKQEGCCTCKPGGEDPAAANLGCCNQHVPDRLHRPAGDLARAICGFTARARADTGLVSRTPSS